MPTHMWFSVVVACLSGIPYNGPDSPCVPGTIPKCLGKLKKTRRPEAEVSAWPARMIE